MNHMLAQVFQGGGVQAGISYGALLGLPVGTPRDIITTILLVALSFVALLAVIAIVVAGIILIAGFGSDETKDRAKKIIKFTIIGLLVLLFARVIVGFFTQVLPSRI